MKKILYQILVLLSVFIVFSYLLNGLVASMFAKMKYGQDAKTTYAISSSKEDIIILGSSRANHHYNPNILENIFHLSSFNYGRDGMGLFYSEALLCSRFNRSTPKLIILDINLSDIARGDNDYSRLSVLLPYVGNLCVDRLISNKINYWKTILPLYKFNGKLVSIPFFMFYGNDQIAQKGWSPIMPSDNNAIWGTDTIDDSIDELKLSSLRNIIELCESYEVPLIVVMSPTFSNIVKENSWQELKNLLNKFDVLFLDFSYSISNPKRFNDNRHLNEFGANKFTTSLADSIQQYLNLNNQTKSN